MASKKKLAEVLGGTVDNKNLKTKLIAPGEYLATIIGHRLDNLGKNNKPACFLDFKIIEGPETGIVISMLLWLSGNAFRAKKILAKIGFSDLSMLDGDIPPGIVVRATAIEDTYSNTGVVVGEFDVDTERTTDRAILLAVSTNTGSAGALRTPPAAKPHVATANATTGWSDAAFAEMDTALSIL